MGFWVWRRREVEGSGGGREERREVRWCGRRGEGCWCVCVIGGKWRRWGVVEWGGVVLTSA